MFQIKKILIKVTNMSRNRVKEERVMREELGIVMENVGEIK
jgi:hypothetical protein